MRIKYIGPVLIEKLFQNKIVTKIEDLFDLKNRKEAIKHIDGLGDLSLKRITEQFDNITASEDMVLGCLGIKGVKVKRAKAVLEKYTLSELLDLTQCNKNQVSKLAEIPRIGHKFAKNLLEGLELNKDLIQFLMKKIKITPYKSSKGNLHVVFTGFRNMDFEKHLEKNWNCIIDDNFTGKTGLVIARDPETVTSKIRKARDMGIPVLSATDAFEQFKFKV